MKPGSRYFIFVALLLVFPTHGAAQGTREDYERAEQFLPPRAR